MALDKRVLSIFDIMGPIMIGPSSSHTAGVVRIGRMARSILGEEPVSVDLYFSGSMAESYKGMMTDLAIIAGLLDMDIDDRRIKESKKIAYERSIKINIHAQTHSDGNPNAVEMALRSLSNSVNITGLTVGGGEILITDIDEFKVSLSGNKDVMLVVLRGDGGQIEEFRKLSGIEAISIESIPGNSRQLICFSLERAIDKPILDSIADIEGVESVRFLNSLYWYKLKTPSPLFKTVKQMLTMASSQHLSLPQVIIEYESIRSGLEEKEIREGMRRIWHTMEREIDQGLTQDNRLIGGLATGGDAKMLYKAFKNGKSVSGKIIPLAAARAIACGEVNASMDKVVAAPTAGALGVIPAVLLTMAENLDSNEQNIIDALLVAAGIGVLIAYMAPVTGAIGGCQSEIGVASGMAAAAVVQLAAGDPEQAVQGMALALKNVLGLVCDPVAGCVEVPCIKRNVIGVVNALATADMALAGIRSVIPPDEVIYALRNVQTLMPMEFRGSARAGGLQVTKTAERLKKERLERMKR